MSTIKITLDASALQLLMDKDPEFSVAVNQAALAWLRKSIIKPVTDKTIQEVLHACKLELKDYFGKQFQESYITKKWPYHASKELKEKVRELGKDMIDSVIKENLQEKINAKDLEVEFRSKMKEMLDGFRDDLHHQFTSGAVDRLAREVINNKVSEVLEKIKG
jgi:uncharacterized membrane protein YheB (UPF0754 family)